MRAEVDVNPVGGSAGILKAESITEGAKTVETPKEDQEKKDVKAEE